MHANGYRGDSIGKEGARGLSYSVLTKEKLYGMSHVVTAGSCGDITHLIRWGVSPKKIIVTDKNPQCLDLARDFDVVIPPDIHSKDIISTLDWSLDRYELGSVNIDLFNSVINSAPILEQVAQRVKRYTSVFLTFLCAHDPGLAKAVGEENPGRRRISHLSMNAPSVPVYRCKFYPYHGWTQESNHGAPMCTMVWK